MSRGINSGDEIKETQEKNVDEIFFFCPLAPSPCCSNQAKIKKNKKLRRRGKAAQVEREYKKTRYHQQFLFFFYHFCSLSALPLPIS
jgi:hypothetical protein